MKIKRTSNKRSFVCYLGGISGSGKTSITNQLAELDNQIEVFHSSQIFREAAKCHSYLESNLLSKENQFVFQDRMFEIIKGRLTKPICLIEGHYLLFNKHNETTLNCVHPEWLQDIQLLIHLSVKPDLVQTRILKDLRLEHRLDNYLNINSAISTRIESSQRLSRAEFKRLTQLADVKYLEIKNNMHPEDTAKALLERIQNAYHQQKTLPTD